MGEVNETIAQIVEDGGERVTDGDHGRRGLDAFRSERLHPVVIDINMPEKQGIQAIMEMRAERPDAKIITTSSCGRTGNIDLLCGPSDLGVRETQTEPYDQNVLSGCVSLCLGTR